MNVTNVACSNVISASKAFKLKHRGYPPMEWLK